MTRHPDLLLRGEAAAVLGRAPGRGWGPAPLPQYKRPKYWSRSVCERWMARQRIAAALPRLARFLDRYAPPADRFVYFIRDTVSSYIKIGVAKDPRRRLSQLQIGTPAPLELVAIVPGSEDLESALHEFLRAHHVRGEWFSAAVPVEAIASVIGGGV